MSANEHPDEPVGDETRAFQRFYRGEDPAGSPGGPPPSGSLWQRLLAWLRRS